MTLPDYSHRYLRTVLDRTHTIAAVGMSLNTIRPSYFVGRHMVRNGYKVIVVNPTYARKRFFNTRVVADLASVPKSHNPIDMVNIFRRSEDAGHVVDEALDTLLDRGLKTIWMQIGVINEAAAKRAEAKGVEVIMNMCPKMEHQRLSGELSRAGINSGFITARHGFVRPQLP